MDRPQIAHGLAANKEPAKSEQLFQRLFALTQIEAADSLQPLIAVTQNYVRFLMNQSDRLGDVPAAIEKYRGVLIDADGPIAEHCWSRCVCPWNSPRPMRNGRMPRCLRGTSCNRRSR